MNKLAGDPVRIFGCSVRSQRSSLSSATVMVSNVPFVVEYTLDARYGSEPRIELIFTILPPRSAISFTAYGYTLKPIIKVLTDWGTEHRPKIKVGAL